MMPTRTVYRARTIGSPLAAGTKPERLHRPQAYGPRLDRGTFGTCGEVRDLVSSLMQGRADIEGLAP